ncbi:MAG TPA: endonuclease/exonuclease/phosphatase family protein [Thermohalobaculum sp.]|nr:endonuclease/exonuclease/phosphatase family protein [Thermohalobaculum sp.]
MRRIPSLLTVSAAMALLLLALAGYAGRWSAALDIVSAFRLHLAALAGVFVVIAGLGKRRWTAGLALLAMLVAAAGLGPIVSPAQRSGAFGSGGDRTLSVLYANLWNHNSDPLALAAALSAADADILITSETTGDVADGIGGPRKHYPFWQAGRVGEATLRTAIWSKYPLLGGQLYLNNNVAPTAASTIADLGGGLHLGLIGAHFSRANEGLRQVQTDALGPMAAQLARPMIIAGDFNAPPWSWVVTRALEVTGTRIVGGHRITWKGEYPTPFGPIPAPWGHQIDHILLSEKIIVESIETLELPGSDHRGLFVRLRISVP